MSVEYARRYLENKQRELVRSGEKKSQAQKKVADATKKESDARSALSKVKTASTIKTKQRALESASKNLVNAQKAYSSAEADYSKKEKAVADAQKKLDKEEENQRRKELRDAKASTAANARKHADHDRAIASQGAAISKLNKRVEKLEVLPDKITVLMLSSGPNDQMKLRQDKEAREIRDAISRSKHSDSVILEDRWAVRTEDLFQAINETEPTIIHFSGHGAESGELVMEDDLEHTKLVSPETMARVLNTVSDQVRLLVFNACFSVEQAEAATSNIEAAVGMGTSISDDAAIIFASRFYSAIGFGLSLQRAFDQARASLLFDNAEEADTPMLFTADGINPNEVYFVESKLERITM